MMISTLIPRGAVNERMLAYLKEPFKNKFYVVDIYGNRYEIDEEVYFRLKDNGLSVKEVMK